MAPSKEAAAGRFKPGSRLDVLPAGMSRSAFVQVNLVADSGAAGAAAPGRKPRVKLFEPEEGAAVGRSELVIGRAAGKSSPWILVRPASGGAGPWYVQQPVRRLPEGLFLCQAVFGSDDTPPGTRFEILAVLVPKGKAYSSRFTPGDTLRDLPAELQASKVVVVTRGGPSPPPSQDDESQAARRTVQFAGIPWAVKHGRPMGPGPNSFSDAEENVSVNKQGRLHWPSPSGKTSGSAPRS